jgi:hypothetical protein
MKSFLSFVYLFIYFVSFSASQNSYSYSGLIYFGTTNLPVYPGTLTLRSTLSSLSISNSTNSSGYFYFSSVAEGPYTAYISYSTPSFQTYGTIVSTFTLNNDLKVVLIVPDVYLIGSVFDASTNNPISFAQMSATAFGDLGFNYIFATANAIGKFTVSIIPTTYFDVVISVPEVYQTNFTASNPFPGDYKWTNNFNVVDFPLVESGIINGHVYFQSDNAIVSGSSVTAYAGGLRTSSNVNESGFYSIQMTGNTFFTLSVTFSSYGPNPQSSFSSYGTAVGSATILPTQVLTQDLYVEDCFLTGTIVDYAGNPVPFSYLQGSAFSTASGFDTISAQANESGTINVRINLNNYYEITLIPPTGSTQYITTSLYSQDWRDPSACNDLTFVISSKIIVSGIALYSTGEYLPTDSVISSNLTSESYPISTTGNFEMNLSQGTFIFQVKFTWRNPLNFQSYYTTGGISITKSISSTNSKPLVIFVPFIIIGGIIVDSTNNSVSNATFSATAFAKGSGFDYLKLITDNNGHFYGRIISNSYFDCNLYPPEGSSYVITPLPDMQFTTSVNNLTLVIS